MLSTYYQMKLFDGCSSSQPHLYPDPRENASTPGALASPPADVCSERPQDRDPRHTEDRPIVHIIPALLTSRKGG